MANLFKNLSLLFIAVTWHLSRNSQSIHPAAKCNHRISKPHGRIKGVYNTWFIVNESKYLLRSASNWLEIIGTLSTIFIESKACRMYFSPMRLFLFFSLSFSPSGRLITINFPLSTYRSGMRGYKDGKEQSIHVIYVVSFFKSWYQISFYKNKSYTSRDYNF